MNLESSVKVFQVAIIKFGYFKITGNVPLLTGIIINGKIEQTFKIICGRGICDIFKILVYLNRFSER